MSKVMNFTADYANDFLKKTEIFFQEEGKDPDFMYSNREFISKIHEELVDLNFAAFRLSSKGAQIEIQRLRKNKEIDELKKCRSNMDYAVYKRIMDNAVRRRRKAAERSAQTMSQLNKMLEQIKELEVIRHAQKTGLRRFWDHPDYKIEDLTSRDLFEITSIVGAFFEPEIKNKAA